MQDDFSVKFSEVNPVIDFVLEQVRSIFGPSLLGVYLFGSLTYDDFKEERSDIDLQVVIENDAKKEETKQIEQLFHNISKKFPKWAGRVECSFTPISYYSQKNPPEKGRPYFGEKFYADAIYGNEWLINNYLLRKHGIRLYGAEFSELIDKIGIKDLQKAALKDLKEEWEPKLKDSEYFENPHNQSYIVLNLCRILYTVQEGKVGSKSQATSWVKSKYPQWRGLIETADEWSYGDEMVMSLEAKEFLGFIIRKVR
ncbi:DUF4111 domain-containing protein [Candidatus Dojkabacteria bacterium]|nr:DUF4111 domain-containing protein [Candidatus Dojkabacteria bacterium]